MPKLLRFQNAVSVISRYRAFTLIELLIVVAIIAILAAVAVPNLIEAQVRAKVSRVHNDLRTIGSALEAYAVEHRRYPPHGEVLEDDTVNDPAVAAGLTTYEFLPAHRLTTPVAYLTDVSDDPFIRHPRRPHYGQFGYINSALMRDILLGKGIGFLEDSARAIIPRYGQWRLYSAGPDGDRGDDAKVNRFYDPTNGTVSDGDIVRSQRVAVEFQAQDER